MADRISELERLQHLRQSGALTHEEFVAQKAKLLDSQTKQSGGSDWPTTHQEWQDWKWRRPLMALTLLIGALVVFGVKIYHRAAATEPVAPTESAAVADPPATDAVTSPWAVKVVRDAMTDAEANVAVASFPGGAATIELQVACGANGIGRYTATAFDAAGDPVEMRSDVDNDLQTFVTYEARVDEATPVALKQTNPQFNNQVVIETGKAVSALFNGSRTLWLASMFDVGEMVAASRVRLQFHLTGGDRTIVVDQTDPQLAKVLAPCAQRHLNLVREAKAAAAVEAEAERKREASPPTVTDAM